MRRARCRTGTRTRITIVCALSIVPALATAATIVVPTDQATIQAAVDAATTGDTVLVQPGTYTENVVIGAGRENLVVAAADERNPPIVSAVDGTRGPTITIERVDDVTIHDVVVHGGAEGVRVDHAQGAALSGLRVEGAGIGVRLRHGGGHHIVASRITGTQVGQGIRVDRSPLVTIADVDVDDTAREGILVRRSRGATISQTTVAHARARHGIAIVGSQQAVLSDCTASGNDGDGIRVRRSPNLVFRSNDAEQNGSIGLHIDRCIPFASISDVLHDGNQAMANGFRDIVVTRPHCRRRACGTNDVPGVTTTTVTTTTSGVPTSTPTTTNTVPSSTPTTTSTPSTTVPVVLAHWRLYVHIHRTAGADVDVNVPYRSIDAPLALAVPVSQLDAFRVGDQVTAAEIDALDLGTLARFEGAASGYMSSHHGDYPDLDRLLAVRWATRVAD